MPVGLGRAHGAERGHGTEREHGESGAECSARRSKVRQVELGFVAAVEAM